MDKLHLQANDLNLANLGFLKRTHTQMMSAINLWHRRYIMSMRKFMLRLRLFFSRFKKHRHYEEKGFIYEQKDD